MGKEETKERKIDILSKSLNEIYGDSRIKETLAQILDWQMEIVQQLDEINNKLIEIKYYGGKEK